jgi:hypothetical protein
MQENFGSLGNQNNCKMGIWRWFKNCVKDLKLQMLVTHQQE